jgi:hypothetical protein
MNEQLIAALVAAAVSAVVSFAVAVGQLRQGKVSQRIQAQQEISAKYDKMVEYRLEHPEVLSLALRWRPECWDAVYNQRSDEDRGWALYYGYVELCVNYSNAVLHARSKGLLDTDVYNNEHERLIRLLLAEHFPMLSTIVRPDGYVTLYLVQHVEQLRRGGWDWKAEHQGLTKSDSLVH